MNNDKRLFALLSLGLFLAACLAPFIIAVFRRDDLVVPFVVVAGLLALLFGALGWSERLGRTVLISMLLLFVVGGGGLVALRALRSQPSSADHARTEAVRADDGRR
jgi:hypothetical protein